MLANARNERHPFLPIKISLATLFAISYYFSVRKIAYSKSALKTLRKMPRNEAQRIVAKIGQYARDPASLANNVKALAGSPFIRLRVGDWRVIMDDGGVVLEILRIGPRSGIYE